MQETVMFTVTQIGSKVRKNKIIEKRRIWGFASLHYIEKINFDVFIQCEKINNDAKDRY